MSPYDAFCQKIENTWKEYTSGKINVDQRILKISELLDQTEITDSKLYKKLITEDENRKTEITRITEKIINEIKYNK